MMTRRAAKGGPVNGSPSTNGSLEDSESRRGSFDDLRPITSHSNGDQVLAVSGHFSDAAFPVVTPEAPTNGFPSSEEMGSNRSKSKDLSPIQQTPSPSRKRKRSSSTTTPPQLDEQMEPPDDEIHTHYQNQNSPIEQDAVDVINAGYVSDRDPSRESSQSEGLAPLNDSFTAQSGDVTPAVSDPVSPATSESASQDDDLPLAKPLGAALEEIAQASQDERADVVEDVDEDGADDMDEADEQVRSDDDGRPRRRFGGRRRAAHPVPKVEAAMRRQAELKSAYRAIARAQKAVLAEIAQRTVDDLEANPELHTQTVEYENVKEGLDEALEKRDYLLQAQHELNIKQLRQTLEAEQAMLKARWKQQVEDYREAQLDRLEHEILQVARAAQTNGINAECETEDEDDVVPMPKGMGYRWKRTDALDVVYDSRSRLPMETVRATTERERRFEMRKLLDSLDHDETPEDLPSFTVMNPIPRKAAVARRESIANANTLAEAAAEVERVSKIPVIPNEKAHGLQLLGDLASRPSIRAGSREASQPRLSRDSLVGEARQRSIPPHLQLHTNYGPSSIPVEMSPRTTQAMGDRFENVMPPPLTPRHGGTPFVRSPEVVRGDQPAPPPTANIRRWSPQESISRFNDFQQSPTRPSDSRPGSWNEPFSEYNRQSDVTQHRSEHRQGSHFAAPQTETRRADFPLWREYPREQPASLHRRNSSQSDRPRFTFPLGMSLRDERQSNTDRQLQDQREFNTHIKNESSPHSQLHDRTPLWPEPLSQGRASGVPNDDQRSPTGDLRRPTMEGPHPPHSRKSSMSFSVNEFRPAGSQSGESQDGQKDSAYKSAFPLKTNKEQRSGLSRRHFSKDYKRPSKSFGNSGSVGSTPVTAPSYANSPAERAPPPAPWHRPPASQYSPLGPPPPPPAQNQQQSPYGRTQPPHYSLGQPTQDYHQHRNSFPPPQSANWNQLPPTPLYAVPQQHHPPPPGVPPDQYHRPFAPPPPPGYHPPSQPQTPQSAPGPYAHQFGGQPIAPATNYNPVGFRPAPPLPAFAQQAQQQQQSNSNHSRRRTQSDAPHFSKFHPWQPPTGGRR